jgi:predicted methyltransferase
VQRVDPAAARKEIESAGFVFEGESSMLRSSIDPRTANVFDPSIRGRTDQFVHRYRKPK